MAEEDDFQQAVSSSSSSSNYKRVYIGNLPPPISTDASREQGQQQLEDIEETLSQWMYEQIPNLSIQSIEIVENSGGGTNNNNRRKNSSRHALIDCGSDASRVIRLLHQKVWEGRILTVQREKRNNNNNNNASTTSPFNNNHNQKQNRSRNQNNNPFQQKQSGFGGKGWSGPRREDKNTQTFTPIPIHQARQDIQRVMEEEFKHTTSEEDTLDVAIAATAAASYLAAMGAFVPDDVEEEQYYEDDDEEEMNPIMGDTPPYLFPNDGMVDGAEGIIPTKDVPPLSNHTNDYDDDAPFQMKPMSELLADFGEQDLDWQKLVIPLPTTVPNDVEDVVDRSNKIPNDPSSQNNNTNNNSQLVPKGKAPIHICLTSFGYSRGGGPKRMDGWSHRQPLLPIDCRNFPTVPQYLAWQDGLSNNVKRTLQYSQKQQSKQTQQQQLDKKGKAINDYDEEDEDDEERPNESIYDFAKKTVANRIFDALIMAQNEGGHGYVSPLEMTIYIGSELGKHRSVVICEWAAIQLRKLVRENSNNILHQPISVGTFHRDLQDSRRSTSTTTTTTNSNSNRHRNPNERPTTTTSGKTLKKKQMEMAGDW